MDPQNQHISILALFTSRFFRVLTLVAKWVLTRTRRIFLLLQAHNPASLLQALCLMMLLEEVRCQLLHPHSTSTSLRWNTFAFPNNPLYWFKNQRYRSESPIESDDESSQGMKRQRLSGNDEENLLRESVTRIAEGVDRMAMEAREDRQDIHALLKKLIRELQVQRKA